MAINVKLNEIDIIETGKLLLQKCNLNEKVLIEALTGMLTEIDCRVDYHL